MPAEPTTGRTELWLETLEHLEEIALSALRSHNGVPEWTPDPDLGAVPAELLPDLRRVLATYRRVITQLDRERASLAGQMRAAARAADLVPDPVAVFVDVRS